MKILNNATISKQSLLSTIWVFVLLNMVYADIIGMLRPGYIEELNDISMSLSGSAVLGFAVLMEVPIIMMLLSKVLNRKSNRIANFIAVPLSILWVVVPAFFTDNTPLSYVFFATVEVLAMITIFSIALKWRVSAADQVRKHS